MKKRTVAILAGLVMVVAVAGGVAVVYNDSGNETKTTEQAQATNSQADYVTYKAEKGVSVLEQLKQNASDVVVKQTDQGSYVDSVNGLAGGTDGKYWLFYVDGSMASVGADVYEAKGGEVIEWKFEK